MVKYFNLGIFISIFIFSTIASLGAEEIMSLEDALAGAYKNNPQMLQARQELEAQKGRSFKAKTLDNPQAEFSVGGLKKSKDEEEKQKAEVDSFVIRQPLPIGTKFIKNQIANLEVGIEKSRVDFVWGQVRTQVIQLYAQTISQQKSLEIHKSNLEANRQFFQSVESHYQTGSALRSELARSHIEVLRAENDVLSAEKKLSLLQGELNLTLGRSPEDSLILEESLMEENFEGQYRDYLGRALQNRADLKIIQSQMKIAHKNLSSAYLSSIIPETSVGFERTMKESDNDAAIILEFSYPLWGLNAGEIKEASAEKEKQKIELESFKRELNLDVYKAFSEAELANKQLTIQKKVLEEANELLRQITLDYQSGKIPFVVFLDNLKAIKETRLGYVESLSFYHEKLAELQMAVQDTPIPEDMK